MGKLNLSAGKHCRACLQPSEYQMYSLAAKPDLIAYNNRTHIKSINLIEIYNLCTQIQYEQSNPNWELICQNCFGKLVAFFEFRKMCIESYAKIQEIDSFNGRRAENDEMCIKVEIVDVTQILETRPERELEPELDTNAGDSNYFEHEYDCTTNFSEQMHIAAKDGEVKSDKKDETIAIKRRSTRGQNNAKRTIEMVDTGSKDCEYDEDDDDDDNDDNDDEYDVNNDENESEDDDDEFYSENVKDKIVLSNEPKKSKNSTTTKKESSTKWNHVCDICSKKFFKKHRYDAHMRTHLGLKKWKCDHCERAFDKYTSLKLHITANHNDGEKPIFTCEVEDCNKAYTMKQSLRVHVQKVHEGKKLVYSTKICEQCGKSFKTNSALTEHSYTHTKETPFKCDICPKMFTAKHRLKEHKMRHNGIKNFVCSICGQLKTTRRDLREHMKYHNPDLQFPCELCSSVFTRRVNMKRHMKIVHLGVKTFICPHCNQSFAKSETLKNHVMTHTGERPFTCSICDRRFIQKVALKTHMKTHNKRK